MQIQLCVPPKNLPLPASASASACASTAALNNKKQQQVLLRSCFKYDPLLLQQFTAKTNSGKSKRQQSRLKRVIVAAAAPTSSSGNVPTPTLWDTWFPHQPTPSPSPSPSLSDVLWPSLGAFAAMAMLGKVDQILAPKGLSMTIAPLGAVCAVLFITPKSPAARKYNMFMAQIGCAALGVLAFTILGPGWLARSAGLSASIAFMIYTKSTHPPAASLPLLFIDGAKLHGLNYWYALFPGAAGCIPLSLLQEIVYYLKENFKF